jgi:hypothetical protein
MTDLPDETPPIPELTRLSRDAEISELGEARTVAALRARGLLGQHRGKRRWRTLPLGLRIAAGIALFLAGFAAGARYGHRGPAAGGASVVSDSGANAAALAVQRTGGSFVRAISSAATGPWGQDPGIRAAAHEAAWNTLRTAQALLERTPRPTRAEEGAQVIWF